MTNSGKTIFTFILGAAVGAAVAWKVLEKRFENRFSQAMELEREALERHMGLGEDLSDSDKNEEKNIREIASEMVSELGYAGEKDMNTNKPLVINPDVYGEIEEYDIQSLIYYADGILTDDCNNPIENVEDMVGLDFADHFGEFEPDSVFIRNDKYKTYYEINRDLTTFSDSEEEINRLMSLGDVKE
jgi:hypothetical protein